MNCRIKLLSILYEEHFLKSALREQDALKNLIRAIFFFVNLFLTRIINIYNYKYFNLLFPNLQQICSASDAKLLLF